MKNDLKMGRNLAKSTTKNTAKERWKCKRLLNSDEKLAKLWLAML